LLFNSSAVGQTFTIPLSVPAAGTYQLGADMTTAPHYGDVAVTLDGSTSLGGTGTTPFDGYNPVVSNSYLDLGTQPLTAGTHTLTFTITGQDPDAEGYQAGINYLTLSPTNRYEADNLPTTGPAPAGTSAALGPQCLAQPAWSDNCQLLLANTTEGTSFTVSFTTPVESDYALGANLTTGDSYGKLRFDLDPATSDINLDNTATDPIDTYTATQSSEYVFLGGVHLTAGTHVLQVTVTGTDPASSGDQYDAGLNYLESAPVTGAADASFTSAMNNLGMVSDGSSVTSRTGNFDLTNSTGGNNLSVQSFSDAGITTGTATGPGSTFSLNGATFTMPQLSASGSTVNYDNVIPDGQTIPLPAVQATGVALLVAATCGPTPAATATLNYSGAQSSDGSIPPVPDWLDGSPSGSVMQLSYFDAGSTPKTTKQPLLFEVMLPANPNAPLASITLPVMTANFLTSTGSCAISNVLHILAIGTRTVPAGPSGTVWNGAFDAPTDTSVTPSPAMTNQTLREVVPVSSDGSGSVRIHLSNAQSSGPVAFTEATIAAGATTGVANTLATPQELTFGSADSDSITLPAGADAWSNPIAMPSTTASGANGDLVVSMYVPSTETVASASIHDTANLSTYWAAGNDTSAAPGSGDFTAADSLAGQYYLTGIDVSQSTPGDGTIAVLGDQTATSAPAGTYGNWTSDLPSAFTGAGVSVPGSIVDASTDDGQPTDWWRMNGIGLDTATTAYDSGSNGTDSLTLNGSPAWSASAPGTGTSMGSLSLNGTSQYAQSNGPVITSTSSFAVSAWVNLSSLPSHNATVAAQDGATDSGFYLGYDAAKGEWAFYFAGSDTTSPAFTYAYGPAAVAGTWTNLVGVYNAAQGQIQLWVNGVEAGSTSFTPSWTASGGFTVGRDLDDGTDSDFFPGLISDVRAYNDTVIGPDNVQEIYNDNGMSSITTSNAATAFEDDAADEPNLRDVIISLGTNDFLEGQSAATIENNLRALITDIEGRYVNDESGATVHVFIATIPPLGLTTNSPRETVRETVNTWILNDTTAMLPLDIASAVEESTTNLNDVNPAYLTDGVPNAAYYSQIASTVANVIASQFPPISLSPRTHRSHAPRPAGTKH
jgi:hypothetical protein